MKKVVPFIFILTACAPSEDTFEAKFISINCEKNFECTPEEYIAAAQEMKVWLLGEDAAQCEDILNRTSDDDTVSSDLVYNKEYAEECLLSMEALSCEDFQSGIPTACEDVYSEE